MAIGDGNTSDDVTTDPIHGKDKKSKQQRMLIVIGIVGLVLTYVLLRSRASGSSGAQATGTATTGTDQALAQYEQQNEADLSGLAASLQQTQAQVAGITSMFGSGDGNQLPITSATGGSSSTGTTTTGTGSTPTGGGTVVTSTSTPPAPQTGLFGGSIIGAVGNPGAYQGDAAGYVSGFEDIGGNPYTDYTLPGSNTPAQNAALLYGPGAAGAAVFGQYDPQGGNQVAIPVYSGEPVVGGRNA